MEVMSEDIVVKICSGMDCVRNAWWNVGVEKACDD